jgi:hypothetical protein
MAPNSRSYSIGPEQRRALTLLAGDPHGATEEMLMARGFTSAMLASLIVNGLATARHEMVRAGARTVDVVRVQITDAGRKALKG